MKTALKERKDVDKSLTWDLSSLFQTEELYNLAIKGLEELTLEIEKKYKEKLDNASIINECLDKMRAVLESENLVENYASLQVSTDQSNEENQARYMKSINILSNIDSRLSFVASEINEVSEKVIDEAIKESKENSHYLNEIKRFKKHSLHPEVEKALSALSGTLDSSYSTYETTKLSDMDFEDFIVDGTKYPLSYVLFEDGWEYETDTKIRRAAFEAFSSKLGEYKHTVASLYQTHVQKEKTLATLRGFDSVIDSLLFPQQVERELYDRQIDIIMEKLAPHMRKYAKLLGKIHKIDEMTFADLKLEVDPTYEPTISVEESKNMLREHYQY